MCAASCPDIDGYIMAAGQDHAGDDIDCVNSGADLAAAAASCSSQPACAGFSVLPDSGSYCTKLAAVSLVENSFACFYTRIEPPRK